MRTVYRACACGRQLRTAHAACYDCRHRRPPAPDADARCVCCDRRLRRLREQGVFDRCSLCRRGCCPACGGARRYTTNARKVSTFLGLASAERIEHLARRAEAKLPLFGRGGPPCPCPACVAERGAT